MRPCPAPNPAIAFWLQGWPLAGRVAELGSLGGRKQRMSDRNKLTGTGDPHDLNRFVQAQEHDYERALSEVKRGQKQSHWMWYIFPQFEGLGFSTTSKRYSIKSV